MLKAISIMATSKNLPLENFMPGLKESGKVMIFPTMIPNTSEIRMALNPSHSFINNAPTTSMSVNNMPRMSFIVKANVLFTVSVVRYRPICRLVGCTRLQNLFLPSDSPLGHFGLHFDSTLHMFYWCQAHLSFAQSQNL